MKQTRLVSLLLCAVIVAAIATGGKPGKAAAGKTVHVIVVVPSSYTSTITPSQASAAAQTWLGAPSDAACSGSTSCSIEGWFRSQVGEVFNYDVTVDTLTETIQQLAGGTPDACGSYGMDGTAGIQTFNALSNEYGYHQAGNRTMLVVLGAGGSAEHLFAPHPGGGFQSQTWGLVGDWGVEEQNGVPVACIPSWDYPARGFSHEIAGTLGMFFNGTSDSDDPIFVGDVLSAAEIANVLKNSGGWLHT